MKYITFYLAWPLRPWRYQKQAWIKKFLFGTQEFYMNHARISHESVQFCRKKTKEQEKTVCSKQGNSIGLKSISAHTWAKASKVPMQLVSAARLPIVPGLPLHTLLSSVLLPSEPSTLFLHETVVVVNNLHAQTIVVQNICWSLVLRCPPSHNPQL